MQDEIFSWNLALKYVKSSYIRIGSAEPDHAKPDHFNLAHVEPNQDLHRQIIMWDLHSCAILHSIQW
jgi:hypothetical protein